MSDLYWISVLGNLGELLIVFFAISAISLLLFGIGCIIDSDSNIEDDDSYAKCIKGCKISCIAVLVTSLFMLFTPSREELYLIYGVGGTMDYLKSNPTAKQLPDKCIKAIDKWVDNLNEDDEKGGKE